MKTIYTILTLCLLACGLSAQNGIYPITTTVQINPPATTYLTDFIVPGSNKLVVNLFMNDFNEPEYDVRLQVSIEGNGISLVSNPGFLPAPTTVNPGGNLLTGSDLEEYLNPVNMIVNGINPVELLENGSGLPEGMYTICVTAFDYRRPTVQLSLQNCNNPVLLKNYPPIPVFPACGATLPVQDGSQNVYFQWQRNADASIQAEYFLTIVEVPPGISDNQAILSANTPILDAEPVMGTSFNYGVDQLPLEVGTRYAYRIQVQDMLQQTTFENDGFSEICFFYYGFDATGPVELVSPTNTELLGTDDQLTFSWLRPAHALSGQEVYYTFRVVEMDEGQDPINAMQFNPVWREVETTVLTGGGNEVIAGNEIPPESAFAWQIRAWSLAEGEPQQIGESEIRIFYSSPAIQKFKAGNPTHYMIDVVGLTANTPEGDEGNVRISGTGRVQLRANDETKYTVQFNDVLVGPFNGDFQLLEGEIVSPLTDFVIDLNNSGENSEDEDYNGNAEFYAENVVLTVDDLFMEGRVQWDYPHSTTETGQARVQSKFQRVLYNNYLLLENDVAVDGKGFELLEPYGFTINFDDGENSDSRFALADNILTLHLNGSMTPADKVTDTEGNNLVYTFTDVRDAYYFSSDDNADDANIRILPNAEINLDALGIIFDLSDDQSPAVIGDEAWRGIYFTNYNIDFPREFDGSNQLILDEPLSLNYTAGNQNGSAWIDPAGMDFFLLQTYTDNSTAPTALFNRFSDNFTEIRLDMEDGNISESHIDGFVFIPLLSATEEFTYHIPIDNNGLQVSFLDDDLTEREVIFNDAYDELRVIMTVKQAVFKDNERLEMVVDLDWAGIQVQVGNLSELSLWGNGNFGFYVPNGDKGITSRTGTYADTYDLTISGVTAAYHNETYGIGFLGSIVLGDESSGISGETEGEPPLVNLTSTLGRPGLGLPAAGSDGQNTEQTANNWLEDEQAVGYETDETRIAVEIPIIVSTPAVDFAANLIAMRNDPVWGDAFYAVAEAVIKKPKTFGLDLKMILGEESGTKYWFVEAGFMANKKAVSGKNGKVIKVANKVASKLQSTAKSADTAMAGAGSVAPGPAGIPLGPVTITEIRGRIYHHMSHDISSGIITDCNMPIMDTPQFGSLSNENDVEVLEIEIPDFDIFTDYDLGILIAGMNVPDLAALLGKFTRPNFKAVLASLPAPDFGVLQVSIPGVDWNGIQTNFPNISYLQLEQMFPDVNWFAVIANLNVDWANFFFDLSVDNIFPDLAALNNYKFNMMLEGLELQLPLDSLFAVGNLQISPVEWGNITFFGPKVTWKDVYISYPEKPWIDILLNLPMVNWTDIWTNIPLPAYALPDIPLYLSSLVNIDWSLYAAEFDNWGDLLIEQITPDDLDLTYSNVDIDYTIDPNTSYGGMFMIRGQDTHSQGAMVTAYGSMELAFSSDGGLSQIGMQWEVGVGNQPNPTTTEKSMLRGMGCLSYTVPTETFLGDIRVTGNSPIACVSGAMHLEVSPGLIDFSVGTRQSPIWVVPGCIGGTAMGWFTARKYGENLTLGAGFGFGFGAYLKSPKIGLTGVCEFYGYCNIYSNIVAFGSLEVQPSLRLLEAGIAFGAGIDIGVDLSGALCPFGDIRLLHLYLGGDLTYDFQTKYLTGGLTGQAKLFGIINATFNMNMNTQVNL